MDRCTVAEAMHIVASTLWRGAIFVRPIPTFISTYESFQTSKRHQLRIRAIDHGVQQWVESA